MNHTSHKNYRGKHIVVCGGSQSLGQCIAEHFHHHGAIVWNLDKEQTATAYHNIACDITDPQAIDHACAEIAKHTSTIYAYIGNAAQYLYKSFTKTPIQQFKDIFSCNVFGHTQCIQQLLPLLKKSPISHIVLMGTDQLFMGRSHNTAYAMSKAALAQLSKSLAAELINDQITVNCLCPSSIADTGMTQRAAKNIADISDETITTVMRSFAAEMPQKELIKTNDVIQWIDMLCQQTNNVVTGQTISLDAGFTQCHP